MKPTSLKQRFVVLLCASLLMVSLPVALGQEENTSEDAAPTIAFLDDPEGDIIYHEDTGDQRRSTYEELAQNEDILRLSVGPDTETELIFALTFVLPESQRGSQNERINFEVGGASYRIQTINFGCDEDEYELQGVYANGANIRSLGCIPVQHDQTTAESKFVVEKRLVPTRSGAPAAPGEIIANISAVAWGAELTADRENPGSDSGGGAWWEDQVGFDEPLTYTLQGGGRASEGADFNAGTKNPIRATNGAEAVFGYELTIFNRGTETRELSVTADGLWDGASVIANDTVHVAAGEEVEHLVYLEIQFGHEHDSTRWFTIRYTDETSDEWAEQDLAMHWLSVPQPSGHHPLVWLHSSVGAVEPRPEDSLDSRDQFDIWMNTLEEEDSEAATDEPVPSGSGTACCAEESTAGQYTSQDWNIALIPSLQLGLQFRDDKNPILTGQIVEPTFGSEQWVDAALVICDADASGSAGSGPTGRNFGCGGAHRVLAEGNSIVYQSEQGNPLPFEVELIVFPEERTVPYRPSNNLILWIEYHESPGATGVASGPGGSPTDGEGSVGPRLDVANTMMNMNLEEYSDPSPLTGQQSGQLGDSAAEQVLVSTEEAATEEQNTPGIGWIAIPLLAAVALAARRRN